MSRTDQSSSEATQREIVQRCRRIETRLTQLLISQGVDARQQKPSFDEASPASARMVVPSMHSSVKEIIDSIPAEFEGAVAVYIGEQHVMDVRLGN